MDSTRLFIGILSYLVGVVSGYLIKSLLIKDISTKNSRLFVLLVVTTIWTISMIVEISNPAYHTNPMVHGLMGSIVGFFYKFEPKDTKEVK